MKRNKLAEAVKQANTEAQLEKRMRGGLTTENEGHTHLIPLQFEDGPIERSGRTSYDHDHDHPWILTEDGGVMIGAAMEHTHELDAVGKREFSSEERERLAEAGMAMEDGSFPIANEEDLKNAIQAFGRAKDKPTTARHIRRRAKKLGLTDLLPTEGKLADLLTKSANVTEDAGDPSQLEDNMTEKTHEAEVQELQDALAKANKLAEMSDAHKEHYSSLESDSQEAFLAKSSEERDAEISDLAKAADDSDPVVYTTVGGAEIHKSAGSALLETIKKADEILRENEELKKQAEHEALVKRAEADLAHLPGEVDVRVALLKAVDGIDSEEVREAAHTALKAQNESLSKAFETEGHGGQPENVEKSAEQKIDDLAKAHAKEHGVSYLKAYNAVMETPEGAKLYAESIS